MLSFAPFLADIADHLSNQYLLTIVPHSGESGSLQEITIKSRFSNIELMAPNKV